jgi:hypothetical protein
LKCGWHSPLKYDWYITEKICWHGWFYTKISKYLNAFPVTCL